MTGGADTGGLWVAKLQAFVPDRLYPTLYLLQTWTTQQEALAAVQRKWRILFPDEEALVWHAPGPVSLPGPVRRPRPGRAGRTLQLGFCSSADTNGLHSTRGPQMLRKSTGWT